MTLLLQPVWVATGSEDEPGFLVFSGPRLVAVLVHLAEDNEVAPGHWFLEASFGLGVSAGNAPTFHSLDAAQRWIMDHLQGARRLHIA